MSTLKVLDDDYSEWLCVACDTQLRMIAVDLEYMGSQFNVELPACPSCGFVLVPEDLALTKMVQVEQLLEDK